MAAALCRAVTAVDRRHLYCTSANAEKGAAPDGRGRSRDPYAVLLWPGRGRRDRPDGDRPDDRLGARLATRAADLRGRPHHGGIGLAAQTLRALGRPERHLLG